MFRMFDRKKQQPKPEQETQGLQNEFESVQQDAEACVSCGETVDVGELSSAGETGMASDVSTGKNAPDSPPIDDAETEILTDEDMDMPVFSISRAQTIGSRKKQEDALCHSDWHDRNELRTRGLIAAVADGIGGLKNGEIASAAAVHAMYNGFMRQVSSERGSDRLLDLAALAHKDVLELTHQEGGMGTTLVSVLIQGWYMWMLSVGDSRIYLYRGGGLLQLNRPHVYGKECEEAQALMGSYPPANGYKATALYAFIGQNGLKNIDRTIQPIRLLRGDRVLLMSDGVFSTLSENELLNILARSSNDTAGEIIAWVEAARKRGQDNATALVIGVE